MSAVEHSSSDDELAGEVAASATTFLQALIGISREPDPGRAISLLLLEITQISLTGARLGAQRDFEVRERFQPDVGPEADLDAMRLRLAALLDDVDTYSYVFDPYVPEVVESTLSDDLTSIAIELETGLRHHRAGDVAEALWWWQFSYVSSWGNLAGVALNALLSIVSHDRLDTPLADGALVAEAERVRAADEMLGEGTPLGR